MNEAAGRTMGAGRELDAEIARRLFGWSVEYIPNVGSVWCWAVDTPADWHWMAAKSEADAWEYAPHYSEDMGDAWLIIHRFDHGSVAGIASLEQRIAFWQELGRIVQWERNTRWPEALALHDLPLLICRAALIASGSRPAADTRETE